MIRYASWSRMKPMEDTDMTHEELDAVIEVVAGHAVYPVKRAPAICLDAVYDLFTGCAMIRLEYIYNAYYLYFLTIFLSVFDQRSLRKAYCEMDCYDLSKKLERSFRKTVEFDNVQTKG